jgi:ABC-type multidrug transport system fused ATPase/permease subunit
LFSYVTSMLWPIQEMARVYAEMQQAIASAERVFSLIDAVPEVTATGRAPSTPARWAATSSSTASTSTTRRTSRSSA